MATQGDATCNKRTQGQRKVPATQKKKKIHKIIATTLHIANYEWWRLVGSPFLTHHVANCDKSCGIFYVPSIAKGKIKDRIPISV